MNLNELIKGVSLEIGYLIMYRTCLRIRTMLVLGFGGENDGRRASLINTVNYMCTYETL